MLPKRERLTRREFEALLKRGRRVHGGPLSLIFIQAPAFKAGVVVSKKTARRATARNTLRRRIYALLREEYVTLQGLHVAVLTRPQAASLSYEALRTALAELIGKLHG